MITPHKSYNGEGPTLCEIWRWVDEVRAVHGIRRARESILGEIGADGEHDTLYDAALNALARRANDPRKHQEEHDRLRALGASLVPEMMEQ